MLGLLVVVGFFFKVFCSLFERGLRFCGRKGGFLLDLHVCCCCCSSSSGLSVCVCLAVCAAA